MDLDDIRLKTPDEMNDEEKTFLREHKDELTDADKKDYEEVLAEKDEEEEEEGEEGEEGEEEKKPITFENQEAFDSAVDKRLKEMQEAADKAKEEEEESKEKKRFFPKDYKPKDWEQFAQDFLPFIRQTTKKDTEEFTRTQRERMAEINKQMDAETEDLRKIDPSIPAAKSEGRREFDRSIAEIMVSDPKVNTVTKAYGVYKERKVKPAGGEDSDKNKNLAKKIGGGGGGEPPKKKVEYKKFAGRTMDDAQEAAEKKFAKLA